MNVLPDGQRYAALWTLLLIDQLSAFCFLVKALLFFWTSLLIILQFSTVYVFSH